jgi:hypothetical protein
MARLPVVGPIRIPSTFEAKLLWTDGEGEWSNVFHFRYSTPPTFGTALADSIFTSMKSAATASGILAQLATDTSMIGVEIKDLNAINQPSYPSTGAPLAGTGALAPLALSLSVEVTLRTAQSGKGFVGRKYFAGLDQVAQLNGRHFTQAAGTAFQAFVDAIRVTPPANSALAIAQRALQAGSDSHGNPMPARPADSIPVIRIDLVDTRFDSQRRRLGR